MYLFKHLDQKGLVLKTGDKACDEFKSEDNKEGVTLQVTIKHTKTIQTTAVDNWRDNLQLRQAANNILRDVLRNCKLDRIGRTYYLPKPTELAQHQIFIFQVHKCVCACVCVAPC